MAHGIRPAGEVRRDGTPTAERLWSGQTLRKFQQLQQRVGTAEAHKTFDNLHPFVRANYGDKVPMINVAVNAKTGRGRIADGMVTANKDLSAYLEGHAPAPAHLKTIIRASHGEKPAPQSQPFMYKTLDTLPPTAAAAHVLAGVSQALAHDPRKAPSWRHFEKAVAAIDRLPGEFVRVQTPGGMVFQKNSPEGKADITYLPDDGIAIRVESTTSKTGFALSLTRGANGAANIMSSKLAPDNGVVLRFVATGKRDIQAIQNSAEFVQVYGL